MSPEVRAPGEKPIGPTLIRVVGQSAFLPASAESAKIGQSAFPLRSRFRSQENELPIPRAPDRCPGGFERPLVRRGGWRVNVRLVIPRR